MSIAPSHPSHQMVFLPGNSYLETSLDKVFHVDLLEFAAADKIFHFPYCSDGILVRGSDAAYLKM